MFKRKRKASAFKKNKMFFSWDRDAHRKAHLEQSKVELPPTVKFLVPGHEGGAHKMTRLLHEVFKLQFALLA